MCVDDFEARSPDEISLSKGDRLALIERDDEFGDGWFLGRHLGNGKTGLFPGGKVKFHSASINIIIDAYCYEVYTTTAPRSSTIASKPFGSQTIVHQPDKSQNPEPKSSYNVSHGALTTLFSNDNATPQPLNMSSQASQAQNFSPPSSRSLSAALSSSMVPLGLQRTSSVGASNGVHAQGQDSPVMNETLSVIDEHITDMNTPRHSVIGAERRGTNDSGSEYSGNLENRISYIPGHETDEEENEMLNTNEVSKWSAERAAEYLRDAGVEESHCKVFVDEEFSGIVLLNMDQSQILLKELDLGPIGRRLKTWHKVQALQEECKGTQKAKKNIPDRGRRSGSQDSHVAESTNTAGAVLPRIPDLAESQDPRQQPYRIPLSPSAPNSGSNSPHPLSFTPATPNSPRRPSAASIREYNHSRRHSSADYGGVATVGTPERSGAPSPARTPVQSHKKQASFDREWSLGAATSQLSGRPSSSSGHQFSMSIEQKNEIQPASESNALMSLDDLDRGYFSGGELDNRKNRNVLRKREGVAHSRSSSYTDEQRRRSATATARQSRVGSADAATETAAKPARLSQVYNSTTWRGRFNRPLTTEDPKVMATSKDNPAPAVTMLELDKRGGTKSNSSNARGSHLLHLQTEKGSSLFQSKPRMAGLRAISDAVTGHEKALIYSPIKKKDSPLQSPIDTGSSTPSGSKSFEIESAEPNKTPTSLNGMAKKVGTRRKKSKKETSAYTRGLVKKSPPENMVDCDYSGWMKKKSNRIMTLWKPRLFVLKGRRLSYYYSEDDTEEQGLIDISYHRVLPADSDRITGLHATLTRATASPSSPENPTTPTLASQEAIAELKTGATGNKNTDQGGMYIFKLEPPRSGIGTNFTRPEVHYFAVDNITQGRAWMAALVKATIDIDTKMPMTTTYNQPTISLARARKLKHRPPALRDLEENEDQGTGETQSISEAGGGLGIDFEGSTDVEVSEVKSSYTEIEAGQPRISESVTEVETEKSSERAVT